jgi:hypothetical protein
VEFSGKVEEEAPPLPSIPIDAANVAKNSHIPVSKKVPLKAPGPDIDEKSEENSGSFRKKKESHLSTSLLSPTNRDHHVTPLPPLPPLPNGDPHSPVAAKKIPKKVQMMPEAPRVMSRRFSTNEEAVMLDFEMSRFARKSFNIKSDSEREEASGPESSSSGPVSEDSTDTEEDN